MKKNNNPINGISAEFEKHIIEDINSMGIDFFKSKNLLIIDSITSKGTTFNVAFNAIKNLIPKDIDMESKRFLMNEIVAHLYFATNSDIQYKAVSEIIGKEHCSLIVVRELSNKEKEIDLGSINGIKMDKVIMNPPFEYGGKIWEFLRTKSNDIDCLMTLSQYKENKRYKYIDDIKIVGGDGFDASIANNLCITKCSNTYHNENSYLNFVIYASNDKWKPCYLFNRDNNRGIKATQMTYHPYTEFNIDTDFVETARYCTPRKLGGSGFGLKGFGYKYNVLKEGYEKCWNRLIAVIPLSTKKCKDNFSTWWYSSRKEMGLSSWLPISLNLITVGEFHYLAIPQIDWEKISEHEEWKKGNYDTAVLDMMSLKWKNPNDHSEGVISK